MTASNMERRVAREAVNAGLTPFIPLYCDLRGRERVLFKNYAFVRYHVDTISALFSLRGVNRVLMDGSKVALMRHSKMAALRARRNSVGYVVLDDQVKFNPGDRVKVLTGRFAGCIGIHMGMSARERELVLFDMLGNEFEVEVFADRLVAA